MVWGTFLIWPIREEAETFSILNYLKQLIREAAYIRAKINSCTSMKHASPIVTISINIPFSLLLVNFFLSNSFILP